jgi:hypothetical protein
MPKATRILPSSPYHNVSVGDLVDRLGAVKTEIGGLQSQEKALREELIRRGTPIIDGAVYSATITEAVRWSLDTGALRTEMGSHWYDARCRQSVVTTVAVKARPVAVQLAA